MPWEPLNSLIDVTEHPYGFRFDWVTQQTEALARIALGTPPLTISSTDVVDVMDCAGLWEARSGSGVPPDSVARLRQTNPQLALTRRLARLWMATNHSTHQRPLDFIRTKLSDHAWASANDVSWVEQQRPEERLETEHEIAAILSRISGQVNSQNPDTPTRIRLERPRVEVGHLTLVSDDIDLCIGTHQIDCGGAWANSVLINFCLETPSESDLERLGFSAVMHTISTGCPPARVISYGLLNGVTDHRDVDAAWLSLHFGFIMATRTAMERSGTAEAIILTPGSHCSRCLDRRDCPFSEIDPEEF